jgi:hypothetical protein
MFWMRGRVLWLRWSERIEVRGRGCFVFGSEAFLLACHYYAFAMVLCLFPLALARRCVSSPFLLLCAPIPIHGFRATRVITWVFGFEGCRDRVRRLGCYNAFSCYKYMDLFLRLVIDHNVFLLALPSHCGTFVGLCVWLDLHDGDVPLWSSSLA